MAGKDNLRTPTTEEARERGRKGGQASVKAHRERKAMKETIGILLSMPLTEGAGTDVEQIKNLAEARGRNITVQDAIVIAMAKKAMKGDVRAGEFLRDTIGENPKNFVEVGGNINNPFEGLSTEDLKKLIGDD